MPLTIDPVKFMPPEYRGIEIHVFEGGESVNTPRHGSNFEIVPCILSLMPKLVDCAIAQIMPSTIDPVKFMPPGYRGIEIHVFEGGESVNTPRRWSNFEIVPCVLSLMPKLVECAITQIMPSTIDPVKFMLPGDRGIEIHVFEGGESVNTPRRWSNFEIVPCILSLMPKLVDCAIARIMPSTIDPVKFMMPGYRGIEVHVFEGGESINTPRHGSDFEIVSCVSL